MSEPLKLAVKPTVAERVQEASVKLLQEALNAALAGNVTGAIVILKHPGGNWSDDHSGSDNFPDAIGRLEIVKQSWIRRYLEENNE